MNEPIALVRLLRGDIAQRFVINGLYKTVAQCIEHRAEGVDILRRREVLLCVCADRSIVDNRTAGDRICTFVNQDRGIHEVAICVLVTRTELRKLACCSSYAVLVALSTRGRVEHRAEPALGIMSTLKLLLVESEGIPRRFG